MFRYKAGLCSMPGMGIGEVTVGWFELVLITVLTVVVLVAFVRAPRDAPSVGRRFARDHLAYVDSEFVAAFDRETVRRSRVSAAVLLPAMTWYVIALFGSETSTLAATLTPAWSPWPPPPRAGGGWCGPGGSSRWLPAVPDSRAAGAPSSGTTSARSPWSGSSSRPRSARPWPAARSPGPT